MAPRANISAPKQALCLQWIQKSGVAHTLKDLEKHLPSVASINSMAVKDYLGSMSDENMIRVEKIGSGNWFWCFLSDERMRKEGLLEKAQAEKDKIAKTVEDLEEKIEEAEAEREDDEEEMMMDAGGSRADMTKTHGELTKVLEALKTELAAYSDNDPVEVERKRVQLLDDKGRVEALTDAIYSMEGWFKQSVGGDKQTMLGMKQGWYGAEFDEEAGGLREI